MKLYYSKGACSLTVRIIIHEIGLKCDFEAVNLQTKVTETGNNFLEINPKGSVPALITNDKKILTENSVIQQYLADTYNATELLPKIGDFKRYQVLEWLNFVSTELHKGFGPLFRPNYPTEAKEQFVIPLLKQKLMVVEKHLAQQKFLMGDHFTVPDAYLFIILRWLPGAKLDINEYPSLARYFSELTQRKSVHQALQEEGL